MKLKTTVGQILLTHPKDTNFTSLYEETLSKFGQSLELFVVLEIDEKLGSRSHTQRAEYEKLSQALVQAFKKTYISSTKINEETFEKALAAVNQTLARVASKSKVSWHGKLSAALGAIWENELSISVAGSAVVYLLRKNELTLLSEDLAENKFKPIKIFSNFASGKVAVRDRVLFSTNKLMNFVSLDRLREFVLEDDVSETCQEIISALADVKDTGFASFIFEFIPANQESVAATSEPKFDRVQKNTAHWAVSFMGQVLLSGFRAAQEIGYAGIRALSYVLQKLFRSKSKKYLLIVLGLLVLVLVINIGLGLEKRSNLKSAEERSQILSQLEQKLDEAEAALIYNDENLILSLTQEADSLISDLKASAEQIPELSDLETRLLSLKNKVNKEQIVDSPTVLTEFPNIPTDLQYSPNGILGFNRNTGSLAFYDFRTGANQSVLADQNTGLLARGGYAGGSLGFVFVDSNQKFHNLDQSLATLNEIATPEEESPLNNRIQAMEIFGESQNARIYLLDGGAGQIWKLSVNEAALGTPGAWFGSQIDALSEAQDLAIDGNIYVLYPDRVDKYFAGASQGFNLGVTNPALASAEKIFTRPDNDFLYITEPAKRRIMIYNKQGGFEKQIISDRFSELSDIWVDEQNGLIYALTGAEILQINLE